jgi:hypothetical protein
MISVVFKLLFQMIFLFLNGFLQSGNEEVFDANLQVIVTLSALQADKRKIDFISIFSFSFIFIFSGKKLANGPLKEN